MIFTLNFIACRSRISQRRSGAAFPYPDPTKIKDGKSGFTARLVALAKLECETLQQEVQGGWGSQTVLRPSSARTTHSRQQHRAQDTKRVPRSKSAMGSSQAKVEISSSKQALERNDSSSASSAMLAQSTSSVEVFQDHTAAKEGSQSQSELFSPPPPVDEAEESTSDLGLSIESLCLSEEAVASEVVGVEMKQAWQEPQDEGEGALSGVRYKSRSRRRALSKSSSSSSLKGRRTSHKRKGSADNTARSRKKL